MQGRNIINFRSSDPLKDEFQGACQPLQTNMTAELNRMIRGFIHEHSVSKEYMRPLRWFSSYEWSGR